MGEYIGYPGLLAGATFASYQYHIVKIASTAGEVVRADAKTDELFGVIQNDPADGEEADIACIGFCKVVASTAVTAGSWITTDTTGRAVAASSTADGTGVIGYAPIACSNAGDIFEIIVQGPQFMHVT